MADKLMPAGGQQSEGVHVRSSNYAVDAKRLVAGQHKAQEGVTQLERTSLLDIYLDPVNRRKSSIICTIGPASIDIDTMRSLAAAGMNIVRLNFSHGDYDYHGKIIDHARVVEAENEMHPLAVALDTKGPEVRTGLLKEGLPEAVLTKGETVVVTTKAEFQKACDSSRIYVDYENMPNVMKPGNVIYIDDGLLSLQVEKIDGTDLTCTVLNSAKLGSRKGVNLPNVDVDLPAMSEKDKRDLSFGVERDVDMVFASFIRKKEDILSIREHLGEKGKDIKIIAKIENHEGVRNYDEILEVTDGVMVARGDLGIEIPPEKVFLAQKMMIAKCNMAGKPVICATQMLETMTVNPRPTRAEVSDVANAIIDGADCVMLSGETAKGQYPVQAVEMMAQIAREAESALFYRVLHAEITKMTPTPSPINESIASAAVAASYQTHAAAIVVLTTSGTTARLISKYHPACPIITITRKHRTARQVHLHRGCYPVWYNKPRREGEWQEDVEDRFNLAFRHGKNIGVLRAGDVVLGVQGWRSGSGATNTLRFLVCP
mmetsp:Transcript_1605/g.4372  ORF Transcript_1605/g.4372 Transcript_1605/m.4372 type:complete len:544 (+) Transcript_1605:109-1740(+)|eukprot:CAMPEP_0119126686 /NCGR_PEP_ID=MMETSP1310-20130426/5512_1 /TAXON_ID=464262 /ORGANISM="Genus nov. species nov., Strain RCC2339" /LENGTH=543 /DNA_ID=CAMNT_0007116857 /DNA_START=70 /DNA_END=1704 /DNA_ORIENTATION=-